MDELVVPLADVIRQLPPDTENIVPAADHGGDAHGPGLVGKGAVPEANQLSGDGFIEVLQQAQHMSFGSAGVAAADEMNDFHENLPALFWRDGPSLRKWSCEMVKNIIQYFRNIVHRESHRE